MPLLLKRDPSNGVIYNQPPNQPATPMVLRGAHCHLFGADGGVRFWGFTTGVGVQEFSVSFPASEPGNPDGCERVRTSPTLQPVTWGGNFAAFLDRLVASGCNLVRVFLSDGVFMSGGTVTSLHPYVFANFKWRIAAATRGDASAWSTAYFNRLRDFVQAADARGVVVQLCLFTHHDLTSGSDGAGHAYWSKSFWNPDNADVRDDVVTVITKDLGTEGQKASLRNQDFLNTERTGLMAVQRAFVVKVLETVYPLGNVILELNNEPRVLNDDAHRLTDAGAYMARWLDTATGWIISWLASRPIRWRPLISANASGPQLGLAHDVDSWKRLPAPSQYAQLDAISYHGLTGYLPVPVPLADQPTAPCGKKALPAVDRASIQKRVTEHRGKHNSKSLIFATDAVRDFPQWYPVVGRTQKEDLLRRDGQVRTSLGYEETSATVYEERARADLDNWAYRVLRHGFGRAVPDPRPASVHFQNHSTTEPSFRVIGQATAAARV